MDARVRVRDREEPRQRAQQRLVRQQGGRAEQGPGGRGARGGVGHRHRADARQARGHRLLQEGHDGFGGQADRRHHRGSDQGQHAARQGGGGGRRRGAAQHDERAHVHAAEPGQCRVRTRPAHRHADLHEGQRHGQDRSDPEEARRRARQVLVRQEDDAHRQEEPQAAAGRRHAERLRQALGLGGGAGGVPRQVHEEACLQGGGRLRRGLRAVRRRAHGDARAGEEDGRHRAARRPLRGQRQGGRLQGDRRGAAHRPGARQEPVGPLVHRREPARRLEAHPVARPAAGEDGGRGQGLPEGRQGLRQGRARLGRLPRHRRLGQELPRGDAVRERPQVARDARPPLAEAHGRDQGDHRHQGPQVQPRRPDRAQLAGLRRRRRRGRRLRQQGGQDGADARQARRDLEGGRLQLRPARRLGRLPHRAGRGELRDARGEPAGRAGHDGKQVPVHLRGGGHGLAAEPLERLRRPRPDERDAAQVGLPRDALHRLGRGEEGAARGRGALRQDRRRLQGHAQALQGHAQLRRELLQGRPHPPARDHRGRPRALREGAGRLPRGQAHHLPALLLRLAGHAARHPLQRQPAVDRAQERQRHVPGRQGGQALGRPLDHGGGLRVQRGREGRDVHHHAQAQARRQGRELPQPAHRQDA
mmetsp:Transcript_60581/g.145721  ORF Transcript_60581/g.145721 Transcript_60581/m.145721 type:complete len:646 (-) Transcript_60581:1290-3227(-)